MKTLILFALSTSLIVCSVPATENLTVEAGYGWSVKGSALDMKLAVTEAVSMLKKSVKRPDYLFCFATVGCNTKKLINEIHNQLGEKVKIYGGTSCLGVLTADGFHVPSNDNGAVVLLGVASDKIKFGVGGISLDQAKTPREAGKIAITRAIEDAKKRPGKDKPTIIFMTAAPGNEEAILEGIADVVGKAVPVFGGSSGDNDITGKWSQFANENVYSNGLALTAVYTDLKVGWSYEAGYLRTKEQAILTKAKGRVIYEIDGKPAAEVYNKWLNGALNDFMVKGGNVLMRTTFFPLAKVIRGSRGETYYLSIHPLSIDMPQKSITVFANVATGESVSLLRGNWELLLNRSFSTPTQACARGNIAKDEGSFALYIFCAGTMLAIPRDEMPKMPLLISDVIGRTPFIGTFTFGEQGYLPGVGCSHGNLVASMVIFGK